jgi:predicted nuclease of predicted toxin-antitoxin system
MKFKLDENLPESLIPLFSSAGHHASSATSQGLGGQADSRIAQVCRQEKRVLITLDAGFADIRAYPPQENAGIIVLRVRHQDSKHVRNTVSRILPLLLEHPVANTLWVVDEHRVRFRS